MKALIIDDEQHCREVVQSFIENYYSEFEAIEEAFDVESGKEKINELSPDLVFLDIQLNDRTCFELLEELETIDFQIIFTTAYDNYAVKAFEYAALHYLLKPIIPSDFKNAVERFKKKELTYKKQVVSKAKSVYIKTVNTSYNLVYDEIEYIQADGSYSTIYSASGEDIFTSKKLSDYKELLNDDFYRVHNSYIVNMNCVRKIDEKNNLAVLASGAEVPISRRRKTEFKQALEKL